MVTLIDELLGQQASLQVPVTEFSAYHDRAPDLADHYSTLIPLSKPGAGEQYAFEVSLDRCTGCKACVSACHSLNGLDDHEAWRDTGVLLGGEEKPAWQQTVTTACHHCEDPGCMNGCPVGAYEKDSDTGIVRHLDDQCIGCSYCILKCPYDVPKYSKKRGIVRKCDMCHQRLAEGEAPACVQACPTEAIRIIKVDAKVSADARKDFLKSSIRDFSITRPTTRYVGREIPETAFAADREALIPQHAHWPLVLMLTLTQAGIGLCAGGLQSLPVLIAGTVVFNIGMIAAVFHLGQPLKAWRFFLGLRTSWLSREILAFSMFAPIPPTLCALTMLPDFPFKDFLTTVTAYSLLPVGAAAVFTSVMIYHDTKRRLWDLRRGAFRFFGTLALFASLGFMIAWGNSFASLAVFSSLALAKLASEILFLRHRWDREWSPDRHSARLVMDPLRHIMHARSGLCLLAIPCAAIEPWLALPVLLVAEVLERQLFFQSVYAPKMPGNFGRPPGTH